MLNESERYRATANGLIFPSPKRRYTPSAVRPEFRSRFSSANSRVAHTDAPNKLIHKPTTFDGSTLWEWRV